MTAALQIIVNAWECLGMPANACKKGEMPAKVGKMPVNTCECLQNWAKTCKYLQMTGDLGAWSKGIAKGHGQREWLGVWLKGGKTWPATRPAVWGAWLRKYEKVC